MGGLAAGYRAAPELTESSPGPGPAASLMLADCLDNAPEGPVAFPFLVSECDPGTEQSAVSVPGTK
jgi:hypothetical protein